MLNLCNKSAPRSPLRELRKVATAATCQQAEFPVGANLLCPSNVHPTAPTSVCQFWKQRLVLGQRCRIQLHACATAGLSFSTATRQGFKDAVLQGQLLPAEMVATLYADHGKITAVTGSLSYKERSTCTVQSRSNIMSAGGRRWCVPPT